MSLAEQKTRLHIFFNKVPTAFNRHEFFSSIAVEFVNVMDTAIAVDNYSMRLSQNAYRFLLILRNYKGSSNFELALRSTSPDFDPNQGEEIAKWKVNVYGFLMGKSGLVAEHIMEELNKHLSK